MSQNGLLMDGWFTDTSSTVLMQYCEKNDNIIARIQL